MAVIKLLIGGRFLNLSTAKRDPDADALYFGRMGEFSPYSDIAFDKHLGKLIFWGDIFKNENGNKLKLVTKQESFWY